MSVAEEPGDLEHAALFSQALRAIRRARRLRAGDVARDMGLELRTYERFEAGQTSLDLDRLQRFAEATDSDPFSIIASVWLKAPEFALRTADNKLMLVALVSLRDFNEDLGDDILMLEPRVLVGAFRRVFQDLTEHVRKRDLTAETWLEEQTRRIGMRFNFSPKRPGPPPRRR